MYALKIRLLKQLNELVEKFDGKSVEEFVVALAKDTDIRLYREEGMLPCYSFYVITIPRGQGIVNEDNILQLWGNKVVAKCLKPVSAWNLGSRIADEIVYYENMIEGDVYE